MMQESHEYIVSIPLYAIVAFGKQSYRFKNFRISTGPILIDFNSLNFEKLRSDDARITGIVSITL